MKYIVRFFVITFLLFAFKYSYAEDLIYYINMDKILNESKAGITATKALTKQHKANIKYFKATEDTLKKEEKNLLAKKNVMKEEEFNDQIKTLRNQLKQYREKRREKLNELSEKKDKAREIILEAVQSILIDYSKQNPVSLIIDKKNIIVGKSDLEITGIIMDELNKKLPSVKLN